jgi:transposase
LVVSAEDRETLERWAGRRSTAQALALRSRIVLGCSTGGTNTDVAEELHVTNATVGRWRSRFVARGPAGLLDEPRSGAPRRISDAKAGEVVVRTLESTPCDTTKWSILGMAKAAGLRDTIVLRIWRPSGSTRTVLTPSSCALIRS